MTVSTADDHVNHGWRVLQLPNPVTGRGTMWGADLTRTHRCSCTRWRCAHDATQEDLLCDWCRVNCGD